MSAFLRDVSGLMENNAVFVFWGLSRSLSGCECWQVMLVWLGLDPLVHYFVVRSDERRFVAREWIG